MSKLKVSGNASGTGVITLEAPNTNTDRTITLPDGDISFGVGIDDNADATAITINASENVGIGTSSPTRTLHVNGNVQIDSQFALYDNVSNNIIEQSVDTLATNRSLTIGNGTYSDINIKLKSSGNLRLNSGSGGIQFNGDTAAANALDDYEEGTWTPALSRDGGTFAGTYSTQSGKYIKIGNQVFFTALVSLATIVTASYQSNTLTGLPFTAGSSQQVGGINVMTSSIFATDVVAGGNIYNTSIYLRKPANVLAGTNLNENFQVGGIMLSGVYTV